MVLCLQDDLPCHVFSVEQGPCSGSRKPCVCFSLRCYCLSLWEAESVDVCCLIRTWWRRC